jgi:ribosome recycling factor
MERANVIDIRVGLQMADEFRKIGISFIPIPYTTTEQRQELLKKCDEQLETILQQIETNEEESR